MEQDDEDLEEKDLKEKVRINSIRGGVNIKEKVKDEMPDPAAMRVHGRESFFSLKKVDDSFNELMEKAKIVKSEKEFNELVIALIHNIGEKIDNHFFEKFGEKMIEAIRGQKT